MPDPFASLVETARKLEGEYPEQVIAYYMSGLGNLERTMPHKKYALKVEILSKVRYI